METQIKKAKSVDKKKCNSAMKTDLMIQSKSRKMTWDKISDLCGEMS